MSIENFRPLVRNKKFQWSSPARMRWDIPNEVITFGHTCKCKVWCMVCDVVDETVKRYWTGHGDDFSFDHDEDAHRFRSEKLALLALQRKGCIHTEEPLAVMELLPLEDPTI